jgi:hypothetical protein
MCETGRVKLVFVSRAEVLPDAAIELVGETAPERDDHRNRDPESRRREPHRVRTAS